MDHRRTTRSALKNTLKTFATIATQTDSIATPQPILPNPAIQYLLASPIPAPSIPVRSPSPPKPAKEFIPKQWKNIGPCDVAAVLGMNPFKSAEDLRNHIEQGIREKSNFACENGIRLEPKALLEYSATTGNTVHKGRWVQVAPHFLAICDGLVDSVGGVEIKCPLPSSKHHTDIPDYYLPQIVAYMAIYKRQWWDYYACHFVEDENGVPVKKHEFLKRIYWVDYQNTWENEWMPKINKFISETDWNKQFAK